MRIPVVTRGLGAGCLLGLSFLTALPACAAEQDELASVQRMLIQVQAALRARVAAVQADPAERGRFFFDYRRATSDLNTINSDIDRYLETSRAQPRDGGFVAGNSRVISLGEGNLSSAEFERCIDQPLRGEAYRGQVVFVE